MCIYKHIYVYMYIYMISDALTYLVIVVMVLLTYRMAWLCDRRLTTFDDSLL